MTKPLASPSRPVTIGMWDTAYRIHKGHRLHWEPVKPYSAMTTAQQGKRLAAIARTWHHEEAA
jgi:hypothetical protein